MSSGSDMSAAERTVVMLKQVRHRVARGVRDKRPPRHAWQHGPCAAPLPPVITSADQKKDDDDDWEMLPPADAVHSQAPVTVAADVCAAFPATSNVTVVVNGVEHQVADVQADMLLIDFLRDTLKHTDARVGCKEGGCGACTVVGTFKRIDGSIEWRPFNSCLRPLCACDGMSILTSQGIGSASKGFHKVQTALADHDGSQCGYCSPGWVMNMYGYLANTPSPTAAQVERYLDGNICRCTGYRAILAGMKTLSTGSDEKEIELVGPQVCTSGSCSDIEDLLKPAKQLEKCVSTKPSHLTGSNGKTWFDPTTVEEVYALVAQYGTQPYRLVAGGTSVGVAKYYTYNAQTDSPVVFINVNQVKSLKDIGLDSSGLTFGAAVSINDVMGLLNANVAKGGSVYAALVRHLAMVANNQVRNVASWAGNIMLHKTHVNFPSDLVTILSAAQATVSVGSASGTHSMSMRDFVAYTLQAGEVILSMTVPFGTSTTIFDTWKVAQRHQNAHALINAGFYLSMDGSTISGASIVIGGLGGQVRFCDETAAALKGQELSASTLAKVLPVFSKEVVPPADPPTRTWVLAPAAYRQSLATTLFYKFFLYAYNTKNPSELPSTLDSAFSHYERPVSSGVEVATPYAKEAPLGQPIHKLSARIQASGGAKYTDDVVAPANTLQAAYVKSTQANADIASIDATAALAATGVVAFISAQDIAAIGGSNNIGAFPGDEEVFASAKVVYIGQPLGIIVADTRVNAQAAAKLVVVKYSNVKPGIFTIPQAMAANSYLLDNKWVTHIPSIKRGDPSTGFQQADGVVTGTCQTSAQYHFFMETQACLAVPDEMNSIRIYSSSQGPQTVRAALGAVLNKPANKIIVTTKRVGGAFGGKLSRNNPVAAAVGVATLKLGQPVRMQQSRNDDMDMMGKRHPSLGNYKVGYKNDGTIIAYTIDFFMDGGASYDITFGCMDMCQLWADNVYYFANYMSTGKCTRTNLPPNTAMRAPGALQGIFMVESVIERVAFELKMSPDDVRAKNFYKVGQTTPYLQPIERCSLPTIWSQLQTQSNYSERKAAVAAFNKANRWRKRGLRMTPVKYGISVSGYQAPVLLSVCSEDGTIMVCHGGVEIGQGINTKVAQAVAYGLGVDLSMIVVTTNSTDKIPNESQTGGSGTSETMCKAALNACESLVARLAPVKKKKPTATWKELVAAAAAEDISLSVTGFYGITSEVGGYPFTYYVWGAACSEVEVDILTGEIQILEVDLVYDCGYSLNVAIDVGQVEGGFIQALGLLFTEDCTTLDGKLLANGTWDYKPPQAADIPLKFNVTFLSNSPNTAPNAVMSSKATGEPPMQLACSTYFAAKDAIYAARLAAGHSEYFDLPVPATPAAIQLSCGVQNSNLNFDAT